MTVPEFYAELKSDYEDILRRFGREDRVRKFLLKFPEDGSFRDCLAALETGDYESAFRAAHTLKGISLNLGLNNLIDSSVALTECLRPRQYSMNIDPLRLELERDYERVISLIQRIGA